MTITGGFVWPIAWSFGPAFMLGVCTLNTRVQQLAIDPKGTEVCDCLPEGTDMTFR